MLAELSTFSRALYEDSRHFLSSPSIIEHYLCEDFPNYLFGSSTAAVSSEKGFYMRMFDGQIRVENNLFLWHFEAKNQKSASEHRAFVRTHLEKRGTIFAKKATFLGLPLKTGTGRHLCLNGEWALKEGRKAPGTRLPVFFTENGETKNLCTTL